MAQKGNNSLIQQIWSFKFWGKIKKQLGNMGDLTVQGQEGQLQGDTPHPK